MGYYKIRLKPKGGSAGWMDDYNRPDPKNPRRTQHFKTLVAAKQAARRNTWGIPHQTKVVYVSGAKKKRSRGLLNLF